VRAVFLECFAVLLVGWERFVLLLSDAVSLPAAATQQRGVCLPVVPNPCER
jgi:hypothetical protein